MTDINPERGEVAIVLDGKPYPMRPSYEAMLAIEKATGATLIELAVSANTARKLLPIWQLAVIVTEGVRAAGKERNDKILMAFDSKRVGELIYANYMGSIEAVSDFLANALSGGMSAKKKQEKTTTDESTTEK